MTKILKPLTDKQYKFTSEYIRNGFNAYQAAISAGYTESYAIVKSSQLIKHPGVAATIQRAYAKHANTFESELGLSMEWKLKKLKQIIDICIPDDDGIKPKADMMRVGLQAIGELNKMAGDYAPDKRLNMTVDATQNALLEARQAYKEY